MTHYQTSTLKLLHTLGYKWTLIRRVGNTLYLYNEVTLQTTRRQIRTLIAEVDSYGNPKMGIVA